MKSLNGVIFSVLSILLISSIFIAPATSQSNDDIVTDYTSSSFNSNNKGDSIFNPSLSASVRPLYDRSIAIQAEDLILSGTDEIELKDETYNNIYVFDTAKLTMRNVIIENVLTISGDASAQMLDGSSADQILVDGNES